MSDQVSWSDTPAFHNTLVVGLSPTSSTTQSESFGEFLSKKAPSAREPRKRSAFASALIGLIGWVKLKHTGFFEAPEEFGMSIIVCLEFVVPHGRRTISIYHFQRPLSVR